jgi:SNF2 family DNA or RNA helicase
MLPFFKHQLISTTFFQKRERGFDASDPGTGKTRIQIAIFANRRARKSGCALIIAPKSLLRSAWEDDFKKFAPHLRVSIAEAANREKAFQTNADVYVTNTDAARWLAKQNADFFSRFETLIIDEISYFKHRTSQRSKSVAKIKKFFKYRYGLTGTPNANNILDIWHQMFLIDDGSALGRSYYHFRQAVCAPKQVGPMPNMVEWLPRPGAEETVGMLMRSITMRHKFEECFKDMPENTERVINYHLSNNQLKVYKRMEKDQLVEIVKQKGGIDTISAVNAATVTTKLLQIASGASYNEGDGYTLIDPARYELVADLVEERQHCVVFFNWTHQRDELIKEFQKRDITYTVIDGQTSSNGRHEAVELFQKGFYRVLLAHPASAGHGLTLTRATTTIWSSPTYNLEHYLQGNRRIYRAGQTKRTETIVVVAQGTIDENVIDKIRGKNTRQLKLLDILKERL